MKSRLALRFAALGYLALLLGIPVVLVFVNAFQDGVGAAWDAVTTPEAQHAFYLTMVMVLVAVPLNTIFGVLCALAATAGSASGSPSGESRSSSRRPA
jgi:sulfate/thiosulfate transport system permease protein